MKIQPINMLFFYELYNLFLSITWIWPYVTFKVIYFKLLKIRICIMLYFWYDVNLIKNITKKKVVLLWDVEELKNLIIMKKQFSWYIISTKYEIEGYWNWLRTHRDALSYQKLKWKLTGLIFQTKRSFEMLELLTFIYYRIYLW